MGVEIQKESAAVLREYGSIPIAFSIDEIYDVVDEIDGRFSLAARRLPDPYVKDYDALEPPAEWQRRFDVSGWAFFSALADGQRIGSAIVAWRTPGLDMLEGRSDLAVLWDIRVVPSKRRQGIGAALFGTAAAWASGQECRELKVETQNVDAAACRFYMRQGCVLRAANRGAYSKCPNEIQLLWYKKLRSKVTR